MPDDQTQRGAAPVNDELEVGFDQRFEQRWHVYEIAGRSLLVVVTMAGLAGLLGSGPYSHRTETAPSGDLAVDFEPVARYKSPTQITVHIRPPGGIQDPQTVELHLDSNFVEPMGLQGVMPESTIDSAQGGGLAMTVALAPDHEALIRLKAQPTELGPIPLTIRVGDGPPLRWTQWILP